jgi:transposase-like protein
MSVLSKPYFHDEAAAFEHLESLLWPDGPICPHCGSISGHHYDLRKTRVGLWKCSDCRKQFTVKVGTVFESAHVPLHQCLQAVHLLCSSKKGISSHQLSRILEVQYKTAWFLSHRIREAMRNGTLSPIGGSGKTVEIDETLSGRQEGAPPVKGWGRGYGSAWRNCVFSLVERGGSARSFHVSGTTIGTLMPIIRANVNQESAVMTDEASWYKNLQKETGMASHDAVNHAREEYVRYDGDKIISTNTVEGYFSIFKRGMMGVYQHCKEKHLHRYLAEFDFRYSNRSALGIEDQERCGKALKGISGKRLTYHGTDQVA